MTLIRSEEQLHVAVVRQPYQRLRIHKRVVVEVRTVEVELRREELVIDKLDVRTNDDIDASAMDATPSQSPPITIVLHEEQPVITSTVVPTERVTVTIVPVTSTTEVSASLAREQVTQELIK